MIVWIKANSISGRSNDQRFKVVEATKKRVIVESCGDDKIHAVNPSDICGFELSEQLTIMFGGLPVVMRNQLPASPYPCCRN